MLTLPPGVRGFVATERGDGRKGMDGLSALVRARFAEDPLSGTMFVFFSRRADRVRVLYWDRDGYVLLTKRLEKGTYRPPWQAEEGRVILEALRVEHRFQVRVPVTDHRVARQHTFDPRRVGARPREGHLHPNFDRLCCAHARSSPGALVPPAGTSFRVPRCGTFGYAEANGPSPSRGLRPPAPTVAPATVPSTAGLTLGDPGTDFRPAVLATMGGAFATASNAEGRSSKRVSAAKKRERGLPNPPYGRKWRLSVPAGRADRFELAAPACDHAVIRTVDGLCAVHGAAAFGHFCRRGAAHDRAFVRSYRSLGTQSDAPSSREHLRGVHRGRLLG